MAKRAWRPWSVGLVAAVASLAGILVVGPALVTYAMTSPACRKSPEFHAVNVSVDGDASNLKERLVFFAGKGYDWEDEQKKKSFKLTKVVKFFGPTMWMFDPDGVTWESVAMPPVESSPRPKARWKAAAAVFNGGRELVLFGGSESQSPSSVLNDLWVFSPSCCPAGGKWRQVQTLDTPAPRRSHTVVANSTHLFVYGGTGGAHHGNVYTDLWSLPLSALGASADGSVGRWVQRANYPAGQRWGSTGTHLVAQDGREFMAIFGGRMLVGSDSKALHSHTYFNDLWLYDFARDSWSAAAASGTKPEPRDHHAATGLGDVLYVFGGRVSEANDASAVRSDLWSFSLRMGSWTKLSPGRGAAPQARYMPGLEAARRGGRDVIVVAAGQGMPGSTSHTSLNDVWAYSLSGDPGWTELTPTECKYRKTMAMNWDEVFPLIGAAIVAVVLVVMCVSFVQRNASARQPAAAYKLLE